MKNRGFELYQTLKYEVTRGIDEIRDYTFQMKEEQDLANKHQDKAMKKRIEKRLGEVQDDFMNQTEARAMHIFEKNHKEYFAKLEHAENRTNEMER